MIGVENQWLLDLTVDVNGRQESLIETSQDLLYFKEVLVLGNTLPRFRIVFNLLPKVAHLEQYLQEKSKLFLSFGRNRSSLVKYQVQITSKNKDLDDVENPKFELELVDYHQGYTRDEVSRRIDDTAFNTIKQIAKQYFTYKTNASAGADAQLWCSVYQTDSNFVDHLLQNGDWGSDYITCGIYDNTFYLVDVTKAMSDFDAEICSKEIQNPTKPVYLITQAPIVVDETVAFNLEYGYPKLNPVFDLNTGSQTMAVVTDSMNETNDKMKDVNIRFGKLCIQNDNKYKKFSQCNIENVYKRAKIQRQQLMFSFVELFTQPIGSCVKYRANDEFGGNYIVWQTELTIKDNKCSSLVKLCRG